jgi:hypothetical protein
MAGLLSGTGVHDTGGLEGSPSIWGPGWLGADRSGSSGILNYTPNANLLPAATASPAFTGGDPYANYVRYHDPTLSSYLAGDPKSTGQTLSDWGKWHWETYGQYEPSKAGFGPGAFPANPNVSFGEAMQLAGVGQPITYTSGLPQPDVEGYKYEYPVYSWGGTEDPSYSYVGHTTADIDEYPYYPYEPTGAPLRSRNDRVLIGQRLVPK